MAMLLLPILFLVPIFFIFLLAMQHEPQGNPRRPPGPKGLPLIGNLHQLDISNPHIWLKKHSDTYGPITFFKLCRLPEIVLSSSQVAKVAMKENDVAFAGRPYSSASLRLSYDQSNIITSTYSDYWRKMRKMVVHHLFSSQKIRSFRPIREEEVSRMISEVSKKASSDQLIDVEEMAMSFTCNLLCRVAFGEKLDGGSWSWRRFEGIVSQLLASATETFVNDCLVYGWINKISGANGRVEKILEEMDSFYQELIDEHLSPNRPESTMNHDILDLLIQLREDESAPVKIDWKHIKAILMNVFLAGIETNGVTITWPMTALMKNPSVMKKLQQEIRAIVCRKGSIDEDDIEKLPYLKAVIKETLRLYAPVPLVPKETTTISIINGYKSNQKH